MGTNLFGSVNEGGGVVFVVAVEGNGRLLARELSGCGYGYA